MVIWIRILGSLPSNSKARLDDQGLPFVRVTSIHKIKIVGKGPIIQYMIHDMNVISFEV